MSKVNASIEIAAPPEEVWAKLMDPAGLKEWVTIHRKLASVSDDPLKKGSTLTQTLCLHGVNFKVTWKVAELDSGKCTVWEGKGPARSKAHTKYVVKADGDGGTRFDYENEFKAPMGPLGAVASRAFVGGLPEKEAKKSLAQLKALLEA